MIYLGIFFVGISLAVYAAYYTPKKKVAWRENNAPRVKVRLHIGEGKYDRTSR